MFSCQQAGDMPEKGVSKDLAQKRKALISDLHYKLFFDIPDNAREPIKGEAAITFNLKEPVKRLALDFDAPAKNLQSVKSNGRHLHHQFANEHIVIEDEQLHRGENTLNISFIAGDLSLNRNQEYMYTLFVPDRASTAFPCFDQPGLKASFQLELNIPHKWAALSNGALQSRRDTGERARLRFTQTKPIPTYLFAFAAGQFEKITRTQNGTTISMYHRETDSTRLHKNLAQVFDLHFNALSWLEDYTGIEYPFQKYDFILIPSFQYSGMEHPGATYYRASKALLEETATVRDELNRANLISHETAHMWFGNLVTMEWFDQVWLKEVFANFMADKITRPQYPDINHPLNFLLNHYPAAYSVDRTRGANPINQTLPNLSDAGTLYGDIIYHKAPIVMRNLEAITGEDLLQQGLQTYLQQHQYGNASWEDLIAILETQTRKKKVETALAGPQSSLSAWSNTWVNEPGMPRITLRKNGSKQDHQYLLKQHDPRQKERIWKQYLSLEIGLAGASSPQKTTRHQKKVFLDQTSVRLTDLPDEGRLSYAIPNAAARGYGYFDLDEQTRQYLLRHMAQFENPLQRANLWINLWENLLHHNLTPVAFHQAVVKHLPRETNRQCINLTSDYLTTNYWRFLTEKQRKSHRRETESLIWSLMEKAGRKDVRSTYFKTYRSIAYSHGATQKLYKVWNKKKNIEGLTLSSDDYIRLAYELMLKHPAKADTIKKRQLRRIENEEKKREFGFIASALSPVAAERDQFFESLLEKENRRKEPWVSQALHYLHHPLRAEQSTGYIRPALKELKEIQATGDIFFPKAWLEATLWGHSSPRAASIVRDFLKDHPDYPNKLRQKILQSADMVFRASKEKKK